MAGATGVGPGDGVAGATGEGGGNNDESPS